MRIEVKGRNLQVTDELREIVARRFEKVDKQVSELATLEVELSEERNPANPDQMVAEANRRGGLDNITAIVIRIDSVDSDTGEHPVVQAAAGERS